MDTMLKGKVPKYRQNKNRKRKRKLLMKKWRISRWKAYVNRGKLHWYVLTIIDVFLNQKRVNVCLYCVFTYIYSLLIEKDICDHQNASVKLPYVYVCYSFGDLFIFSVRVSSFCSYFYVNCIKHSNDKLLVTLVMFWRYICFCFQLRAYIFGSSDGISHLLIHELCY